MADYICSMCKAEGVKLWRPFGYASPLICAKCAEKMQSPAKNAGNCSLPTSSWIIDDKGFIDSFYDKNIRSHRLIVDIDESRKRLDFIPAVPAADDDFWGYTSVPQEELNKWENLPNQINSNG